MNPKRTYRLNLTVTIVMTAGIMVGQFSLPTNAFWFIVRLAAIALLPFMAISTHQARELTTRRSSSGTQVKVTGAGFEYIYTQKLKHIHSTNPTPSADDDASSK